MVGFPPLRKVGLPPTGSSSVYSDSLAISGWSFATSACAASVAKNALCASWLVQPSVTYTTSGSLAERPTRKTTQSSLGREGASSSSAITSSPLPGRAVIRAWKPCLTVAALAAT